jgi:hypothetical protein
MRNRSLAAGGLVVALGVLAPHLGADEGMWMPRQIPELAADLAKRGMELDPARLADLTGDPLGAVVSLGGCTASFVSPAGLIVTNHHCVYGSIQFNATPERDLITDGFQAKTRAEELPTAPGSYVYVTTAIRDVTAEVLGEDAPAIAARRAATPAEDAALAKRIERRTNQLIDACERPGGVRCNVAKFFEGTLFLEITQLEIRDVRLVYAPAEGIGNFGGEIDNWMWPRHTGDFGFLRAYVGTDGRPADPAKGNVPYRPKHWLRFATEGVDPGDLVWIPGYPGRTYRYKTSEEVATAAEVVMPEFVRFARETIALLERENRRGKAVEQANYSRIRSAANTMKKYEGILSGMTDGDVGAQRGARESAIRELAAADPALAREIGDPLAELAALEAGERLWAEHDLVLSWIERASPMLSQAIKLQRMAEERPKSDLDREEGYRDRDLARFRQALRRAQRSIEPESDRATLRYLLERASELPAAVQIGALERRLAAAPGDADAERLEALLDTLYAGTRVGELAERQAMAEETAAQLAARHDPMLDLAAELSAAVAARRERERAATGAALRIRPRYMKALEHLAQGRLYPDANSTLRFTYGTVAGYSPRDAVSYTPQTSLDGVLAKSTGQEPFATPPALTRAAARPAAPYVDPQIGAVPVNFLSTCDITGGNSGSPTLNGRGEIVGLAFDGNIEGVGGDYLFEPEITRTIHVDAVYVRWIMDAVDRAHHLLREMGLPVLSPGAELEVPAVAGEKTR